VQPQQQLRTKEGSKREETKRRRSYPRAKSKATALGAILSILTQRESTCKARTGERGSERPSPLVRRRTDELSAFFLLARNSQEAKLKIKIPKIKCFYFF
jgi:hypothetical protein